MKAEQQYIDLFTHYEDLICRHAAGLMNLPRAEALADLERLGFPTVKSEDYKYTDVAQAFAPDYGVNINRLDIPVNPYDVFRCDVPNLSTTLYFVVNDTFLTRCYRKPIFPKVFMPGECVLSWKSIPKWLPAIMARRHQPVRMVSLP